MKSIRFAFVFVVYVFVISVYYEQSYNAFINTKTKEIEQALINQQAIRRIVGTHYIPELKRLQDEKLLDERYINPYFTSGTLITQVLHEYTQAILAEKGEEVTDYKLASLNPLNPTNQASKYEAEIFNQLNESGQETFVDIITENNTTQLFYAEKFLDMGPRCMECHSSPDIAPINQIKLYGSTHGYNFELGDPSGLTTIRSPLDKGLEEMREEVVKKGIIIFVVFFILYIISELFIYKINKQRNKIAKNKEIKNQLIKESQIDPLTGLLNRRPLEEIFEKERNRTKRVGRDLVFFLIDIDYFKKYNDTYGHIEGDNALTAVAKVLLECFGRSNEHVFRYGGEEFIMISSENTNDVDVLAWVENLNKRLADLKIRHKNSPHKFLTLSIGIYILSSDNINISMKEVIEKADQALYKAKSSGRNKAVVCQEK